MPIAITGQGTLQNGGTANFVLNGATTSLSSIRVSINGGTAVEVWKKSVTCTDLIKWYNWSKSGNCNGVNTNEEAEVAYYNGIQILSGVPSAGLSNGQVWQSITMTNNHKYWLYFGAYVLDGLSVSTPLASYNYRAEQPTVSTVITYTGSSGSRTITVANTSTDVTASDYSRLCFMNIVDLTASFGSGKEPSASWCATNLGIFNGSKTVIPPT